MTLRKLSLIALVLLFVFQGCKQKKNWNFVVQGQLLNAPAGTYARLYKAVPTGNIFIDSVALNKDGSFKLYGKTTGKDFFIVNFTNQDYNIYLLVDSADYIYLTADYNGLLSSYQVRGNEDSRLIQILEQHLDSTRRKIDSLSLVYNELLHKGKIDSARVIDSLIKSVAEAQKEFSTRFVYKHSNSLVALPALSQVYYPGRTIFNPEDDAQLYFMVDSTLGKLFPKNPHVLRLHSFVQNIKLTLRRRQSMVGNIHINASAPDFSAKEINGQLVRLSDFKGKYVYIIFLASWCEPCKQSLMQISQLQNKTFVKIAFILDVDSAAIASYSDKYLKDFIVIADKKLWNSPIVKKYEVRRIPTEYLISPEGRIIAITPDVYNVLKKKLR